MKMTIKERWINFRWGGLNYFVVLMSNGYLGDCHVASNYCYMHPFLRPFLREIVFFQAARRGIKPPETSN